MSLCLLHFLFDENSGLYLSLSFIFKMTMSMFLNSFKQLKQRYRNGLFLLAYLFCIMFACTDKGTPKFPEIFTV